MLATAEPVAWRIVSVHDGDTFTGINDATEQVKVRLDAVDAPELSPPYGEASKKALGDKIFGKLVTVITKKHDRYGRTIGHVLIDKRDVNLELLEVGAVWHYSAYDRNKRLREAEASARAGKKGAMERPESGGPMGLAEDGEGAEGEVSEPNMASPDNIGHHVATLLSIPKAGLLGEE